MLNISVQSRTKSLHMRSICVLSQIRSRYILSEYSDYPIRQKPPKNYRRLIRLEVRFERLRFKGVRVSIYYLIYVNQRYRRVMKMCIY